MSVIGDPLPRPLAPVALRERIDVLDMLRGIAILGIFYMNIPVMGGPIMAAFFDPRLGGWTPADQWVWFIIQVLGEGTQRGMLELLFGAGMMILAAKAMAPDGAVAVTSLYYRRTLWLLLFGLADVFLLLWPGDILHIYALAALFLFPFRRLPPRALIALGLMWATLNALGGAVAIPERVALTAHVEAAHQAQAEHRPLTPAQAAALADWNRRIAKTRLSPVQREEMAEERTARLGSFTGYAAWIHAQWFKYVAPNELADVIEALSTMLIGVAFFKLGIIQGGRSARFYLAMMLASYAFGLPARAIGELERQTMLPTAKSIWVTEEFARLAVTFGHVALVNLLAQSGAGRRLLAPFRAAGRMAFSLYVAETLVGVWLLFPGFALGLWDRFGHAGLAVTATVTIAVLLGWANLWLRAFRMGPLEWAWRSLAYLEPQPFRRRKGPVTALVVGP